ncbi:effector-associated domain EAD1-containing protein [Frankia sp. Mgl5]|uniref:effector-associated domain EAD1-containing protein n=1 Tax=Frankia sp. Mgl5 TaxID=2933793 RepID=UPI00200F32B4|nr:effector-associated domain EAD1-containing protein [Frankia sp. Mgl5]
MPCAADDDATAWCHPGRVVNGPSGQAPLVELADELARIYAEPAVARQLLERAGLDRSRQPPWSNTPREFWYEAGKLLTDGATVDGWDRLIAEALADYPGNRVLHSAAGATELPRRIRPGAQLPTPGDGPAGADDVVASAPPPPAPRRSRRSRGRGRVVVAVLAAGVVAVVLVTEVAFGGNNPDTLGSTATGKRCALVREPVSDVFGGAGGQGHIKVKYAGDRVVLVEIPQRIQDGARWAAVALPDRGDSPTGVGWMRADDLTSTPCEGPPALLGADSPPLPSG